MIRRCKGAQVNVDQKNVTGAVFSKQILAAAKMPFQPALAAEIVVSGEGVKGDMVVRVHGPVRMILRDTAAVCERVSGCPASEHRTPRGDILQHKKTGGITAQGNLD